MSRQPIPDSLREQLARLDAKRVAFAGLSAPVAGILYGRLLGGTHLFIERD